MGICASTDPNKDQAFLIDYDGLTDIFAMESRNLGLPTTGGFADAFWADYVNDMCSREKFAMAWRRLAKYKRANDDEEVADPTFALYQQRVLDVWQVFGDGLGGDSQAAAQRLIVLLDHDEDGAVGADDFEVTCFVMAKWRLRTIRQQFFRNCPGFESFKVIDAFDARIAMVDAHPGMTQQEKDVTAAELMRARDEYEAVELGIGDWEEDLFARTETGKNRQQAMGGDDEEEAGESSSSSESSSDSASSSDEEMVSGDD